MSKATHQAQQTSGGMLGSSNLMARLLHVRKRKRVYDGQTVDMESVRRRIRADQQRRRRR